MLHNKFLSTKEVAKVVGRDRATIDRWVRDFHFPHHTFPNRRKYFILEEVLKYMEQPEKPKKRIDLIKKVNIDPASIPSSKGMARIRDDLKNNPYRQI